MGWWRDVWRRGINKHIFSFIYWVGWMNVYIYLLLLVWIIWFYRAKFILMAVSLYYLSRCVYIGMYGLVCLPRDIPN